MTSKARTAFRNMIEFEGRNDRIGFRVARTLDSREPLTLKKPDAQRAPEDLAQHIGKLIVELLLTEIGRRSGVAGTAANSHNRTFTREMRRNRLGAGPTTPASTPR